MPKKSKKTKIIALVAILLVIKIIALILIFGVMKQSFIDVYTVKETTTSILSNENEKVKYSFNWQIDGSVSKAYSYRFSTDSPINVVGKIVSTGDAFKMPEFVEGMQENVYFRAENVKTSTIIYLNPQTTNQIEQKVSLDNLNGKCKASKGLLLWSGMPREPCTYQTDGTAACSNGARKFYRANLECEISGQITCPGTQNDSSCYATSIESGQLTAVIYKQGFTEPSINGGNTGGNNQNGTNGGNNGGNTGQNSTNNGNNGNTGNTNNGTVKEINWIIVGITAILLIIIIVFIALIVRKKK